jgi:LPXTG-motif cell wall-anchored protein
LSELAEGTHSITVFANDTFGNMGTSETINFTIMPTPTPTPEPKQQALSTTTLVITASGVFIAVVGLGSLVYFKKRKH